MCKVIKPELPVSAQHSATRRQSSPGIVAEAHATTQRRVSTSGQDISEENAIHAANAREGCADEKTFAGSQGWYFVKSRKTFCCEER